MLPFVRLKTFDNELVELTSEEIVEKKLEKIRMSTTLAKQRVLRNFQNVNNIKEEDKVIFIPKKA